MKTIEWDGKPTSQVGSVLHGGKRVALFVVERFPGRWEVYRLPAAGCSDARMGECRTLREGKTMCLDWLKTWGLTFDAREKNMAKEADRNAAKLALWPELKAIVTAFVPPGPCNCQDPEHCDWCRARALLRKMEEVDGE